MSKQFLIIIVFFSLSACSPNYAQIKDQRIQALGGQQAIMQRFEAEQEKCWSYAIKAGKRAAFYRCIRPVFVSLQQQVEPDSETPWDLILLKIEEVTERVDEKQISEAQADLEVREYVRQIELQNKTLAASEAAARAARIQNSMASMALGLQMMQDAQAAPSQAMRCRTTSLRGGDFNTNCY